MTASVQKEILDVLKQKMLPELQQLSTKIDEVDRGSKDRDAQLAASMVQMQAEMKVINGRLDTFHERFEQVDKRFEEVVSEMRSRFGRVEESIRDVHADVREVRSLMFVGKAEQVGYTVREK